MKVNYKKIKTNINWGYRWYDSFSKEELDNYHVHTVLWNAKLRRGGVTQTQDPGAGAAS